MEIIRRTLTIITAFLALLLLSIQNFAQDKTIGIDVSVKKEGGWYTQPWVWIVGGAVFILLLVALLRRGGGGKE